MKMLRMEFLNGVFCRRLAGLVMLAGVLGIMLPAVAWSQQGPGHHPAGFWTYPTIQGYGPVHAWPEAVLRPSKTAIYKVYFDVTKPSAGPDKINKPLAGVARLVNGFGSVGVPASHLKFVVVVHAKATFTVTSDAVYMAKYHVHNPNLPLLAALQKAGVQVYICGNALADNDLTPEDVDSHVKTVVGALITSTMFQQKGYALMRF